MENGELMRFLLWLIDQCTQRIDERLARIEEKQDVLLKMLVRARETELREVREDVDVASDTLAQSVRAASSTPRT